MKKSADASVFVTTLCKSLKKIDFSLISTTLKIDFSNFLGGNCKKCYGCTPTISGHNVLGTNCFDLLLMTFFLVFTQVAISIMHICERDCQTFGFAAFVVRARRNRTDRSNSVAMPDLGTQPVETKGRGIPGTTSYFILLFKSQRNIISTSSNFFFSR